MNAESEIWVRHAGLCFYCGVRCRPYMGVGEDLDRDDTATRDHVQAKSLGGRQLGSANIVLACRACNQWWAVVEDDAKRAARLLRRLYRKRGRVSP